MASFALIASVTATSNNGATTTFFPCDERIGEDSETGRPCSLRRWKVSVRICPAGSFLFAPTFAPAPGPGTATGTGTEP